MAHIEVSVLYLQFGVAWSQILRVFYDRLVDKKDGTWFLDYLKSVLQVCLLEGNLQFPLGIT